MRDKEKDRKKGMLGKINTGINGTRQKETEVEMGMVLYCKGIGWTGQFF